MFMVAQPNDTQFIILGKMKACVDPAGIEPLNMGSTVVHFSGWNYPLNNQTHSLEAQILK